MEQVNETARERNASEPSLGCIGRAESSKLIRIANRLSRSGPNENRLNNGVASHFGRTILSVFDFERSLIWPKIDYAVTLTTIWANRDSIYSVLAVFAGCHGLLTSQPQAKILWIDLSHWTVASPDPEGTEQLLIVLMLWRFLHTVRISIRSHISGYRTLSGRRTDCLNLRRILVITLEAATLTKEGCMGDRRANVIFHSSMIELLVCWVCCSCCW